MLTGIRKWKLGLITGLLAVLWTSAALAQAHDDLYFDVAVRGTGSATIHADVFINTNPDLNSEPITALAVHGWTESASMYGPLADAIFADPVLSTRVERIVSISMVAHGLSSPPTLDSPDMFGDLLIEDNADVIIQAIGYLNAIGMGPDMIMGHSMGGLGVQTVQELLLQQGLSLKALGVKNAVLIAAVPARGTVWTRYAGVDITPFIVYDPVLGLIVDIPDAYCGGSGFMTLSGTYVPGTPTWQECIANDWMSPEPIAATVELVGTYCPAPDDPGSPPYICRPYVSPEAFKPKNGTTLTVLGFSQDVLCPVQDQDDLYTYLTGKSAEGPHTGYVQFDQDDAVHSMYISNPSVVAEALRASVQ